MGTGVRSLAVVFAVFSFAQAWAADPPKPAAVPAPAPPPSVLPQFEFAPNATAVDRALGARYRAQMEAAFLYWKRAGAPTPSLTSISVIASYDGLHVRELLQLLNPDIGDVARHVEDQYRHFLQSDLSGVIRQLEERNDLPSGSLTKSFFDSYCRIRYGYGFANFMEEVLRNPLVESVYADASESKPSDNAYYGRFPKIDLTKSLPLHDPEGKIYLAFLSLISNSPDTMSLFELTGRDSNTMSKRIVFLPRLMQRPGDAELTILDPKEPSVGVHEFGHHINGSLGEVPRNVDEAMADFFWASWSGEPRVGVSFATRSALIAKRLRESDGDPARIEILAAQFDAMAEKGQLRDMSEPWTLDHLTRETRFADAYEGGHPLRSFLWNLRLRTPEAKRLLLEKVALATVTALSNEPMLIAPQTMLLLNRRRLGLELRFRKAVAREAKKQQEEGPNPDGLLPAQVVSRRFAQMEAEKRKERVEGRREAPRPALHLDYINAEFFRAFATTAQRLGATDLLPLIAEEAGRAMNAKGVYLGAVNNTRPLVFLREKGDGATPSEAFTALKTAFEVRWVASSLLAQAQAKLATDPSAEVAVKMAVEKLSFAIAAVQEFERTGRVSALRDPWPQLERAIKQIKEIQQACGKRLANSDATDDGHTHVTGEDELGGIL